MKWFKHISDSLDDPFIFDLMTEFGCSGYVVFFGVIEIYSREFLRENQWKLVVSLSFLHQKLRVSPHKIKKILSKIYKWDVSFNDTQVSIFIPKFTELMDEWTIRKLGSHSGVTPKILSDDKDIRYKSKELEKDKDTTIVRSRKNSETPKFTDEDFLNQLKTLPCYQGIDVDTELSKMDAWLLTPKGKGRKKTRRFIVNWLNKIDKPLEVKDTRYDFLKDIPE